MKKILITIKPDIRPDTGDPAKWVFGATLLVIKDMHNFIRSNSI